MKIIRLVSYIIMENSYRGVVGSGVLGAIYGVFIFFLLYATRTDATETVIGIIVAILLALFIGSVIGLCYGAVVGIVLGVLSGISVGLLSLLLFLARGSVRVYRVGAGIVSGVVSFIAGVQLFSGLALAFFPTSLFMMIVVPSIIAMLVIVYASQRAAKWYLAASTTAK